MDKTLFDLSDEILILDERLGEIPEDDIEAQETVLKEYVVTLQADLRTKMEGYCRYILELESRADLRKSEGKRLLARSKVDADKALKLKEILRWFFTLHGLKNYETPLYRVTLCANGGKVPLEILVPIEELPAEYLRQDYTLVADTDLLRADLEAGVEIEGVRLGERGQSIRIK